MEIITNIASHPSFWGFCLGFLLFILSFIAHAKTKHEYRRFQRHLSDKMELEAKQYATIEKEKIALKQENENFRLKIGQLTEKPDTKIQRDVEIMVRAEKRMMISAPGFAAAWETAKAEAAKEVESEESGKSAPRRFFTKLFGVGSDSGSDSKAPNSHSLQENSETSADSKFEEKEASAKTS